MITELNIMRGPNIWSNKHQQLIVLKLALDQTKEINIEFIYEELIQLFPGHKNIFKEIKSSKSSEQFLIAKLLALTGLLLQANSAPQLDYFNVNVLNKISFYSVFEYLDEEHGKTAATILVAILKNLIAGRPYLSLAIDLKKLADIYLSNKDGPSTREIIDAAIKKNIPVKRIAEGRYTLLGQGKYQKKIEASISENTGMIAVRVAGNKDLTKQLLSDAMIAVPAGIVVYNEDELEEVIKKLGFPLVTKPINGHQGKCITTNIKDYKSLFEGFKVAKEYSRSVIVEKFITGNDYRFLMINCKLVAAAQRSPASVTGDGHSTIFELIEKVNRDPLRGEGHASVLTKIVVDDITESILAKKQLNLNSVLEAGKKLDLKDTANLSTGGTAADVTADVHPDNVSFAERAARIIGLDICGIDIMATDVKKPFSETGGVVLEVNAAPGLRMHVAPSAGTPRKVGKKIIEMMFPFTPDGRIPIVAVTGTNGKTTTTRLMAHIAKEQGFCVGFTATEGIYLDGKQIVSGDCTGPRSAAVILHDPWVDFAVLETARGGIIRSGLAFDQCDIGIVTNVANDHLGLNDIYTVEDMARVKKVVPLSVKKEGYAILNASNDLVYQMAEGLTCNIGLFSLDPENIHIQKHCKKGGIAVVKNKEGDIIIRDGNNEIVVENVENIPITMKGNAGFMTENVMPVVLASYVLKFPLEKIKKGLQSFYPSEEQTPGRLNIIDISNVHVMVDYAHNSHGIKAFSELMKKIDEYKTGIITGVGDRRDEDIAEVGKLSAEIYDEVIIRIDEDTRGRQPEEIVSLIKKGINSVNPELPVKVIPDTKKAILHALHESKPGSYIVVNADYAHKTLQIVKDIKNELEFAGSEKN